MIQELLYTSAPKGLKPGSRGFCTVLSTQGMSAPLAAALEGLSGYRPLFAATDPRHASNPVVHSHLTFSVGGRRVNVLSRIADYGLDYTQRSNKLAHHVIVDPENQSSAGPAWLLARSELMRSTWDGEPRVVPLRQSAPMGDVAPSVCTEWKKVTGDAGWAGVLAEAFLKDPQRMAFLICPAGLDPLPLIAEAIALLPKERRWDVTFSTYFTSAPQNVNCAWRCLIDGTPEVHQSRRYVQALRVNLIEPLAPATGGALVELARTGRVPMSVAQRSTSRDAATAALDDLPPPTGVGGYRLAPVRRVEEPPLLDVTVRAPQGRGRRTPTAMVVCGLLFVSVSIAIGAFAIWITDSGGTNATSGMKSGDDIAAPSDGLATRRPVLVRPSQPTTLAATANTLSATDSKAAASEHSSESIGADREQVNATESEGKDDDAVPTDPLSVVQTNNPNPQPTRAPDQKPLEDSPDERDIALRLAVFQLPQYSPGASHSTVALDDHVARMPEDAILLKLFAPLSYKERVVLQRDGERNVVVDYVSAPGSPRETLARFWIANNVSPPGQLELHFEWIGDRHHDALRWCALQVSSKPNVVLYVFDPVLNGIGSVPQSWKKEYNLPAASLKPLGDLGPELLCDPVLMHTTSGHIEFSIKESTATPQSPVEFTFRVASIQALNRHLKKVELADFPQAGLPRIRIHTPSRAAAPMIQFQLGKVDDKHWRGAFRNEFVKFLHNASSEFIEAGVAQIERPDPDEVYKNVESLRRERHKWEGVFKGMEGTAQDKVKSLNENLVSYFEDGQKLFDLHKELENATIVSARIHYVVVDVEQDEPSSHHLDIVRIAKE